MKNIDPNYHKLTNSLLSPLEAQRLAMNLRAIENARKAQAQMPIWLIKTLLGLVFLYIAAAIIYTLLYY